MLVNLVRNMVILYFTVVMSLSLHPALSLSQGSDFSPSARQPAACLLLYCTRYVQCRYVLLLVVLFIVFENKYFNWAPRLISRPVVVVSTQRNIQSRSYSFFPFFIYKNSCSILQYSAYALYYLLQQPRV